MKRSVYYCVTVASILPAVKRFVWKLLLFRHYFCANSFTINIGSQDIVAHR